MDDIRIQKAGARFANRETFNQNREAFNPNQEVFMDRDRIAIYNRRNGDCIGIRQNELEEWLSTGLFEAGYSMEPIPKDGSYKADETKLDKYLSEMRNCDKNLRKWIQTIAQKYVSSEYDDNLAKILDEQMGYLETCVVMCAVAAVCDVKNCFAAEKAIEELLDLGNFTDYLCFNHEEFDFDDSIIVTLNEDDTYSIRINDITYFNNHSYGIFLHVFNVIAIAALKTNNQREFIGFLFKTFQILTINAILFITEQNMFKINADDETPETADKVKKIITSIISSSFSVPYNYFERQYADQQQNAAPSLQEADDNQDMLKQFQANIFKLYAMYENCIKKLVWEQFHPYREDRENYYLMAAYNVAEFLLSSVIYSFDKNTNYSRFLDAVGSCLPRGPLLDRHAFLTFKENNLEFANCWKIWEDEDGKHLRFNEQINGMNESDSHQQVLGAFLEDFDLFDGLAELCARKDYENDNEDEIDKIGNYLLKILGCFVGYFELGINPDSLKKCYEEEFNKLFASKYFMIRKKIRLSKIAEAKGTLRGVLLYGDADPTLPKLKINEKSEFLCNYLDILDEEYENEKEDKKVNKRSNYNPVGKAITRYSKAVVMIEEHHESDNEGHMSGTGTGFVISSDGYVLTCAHVAGDMDGSDVEDVVNNYAHYSEFYVRILTDVQYDENGDIVPKYSIKTAIFIKAWPEYDLALLKIIDVKDLYYVQLDFSGKGGVETGSEILELGFPYGAQISMDEYGMADIMSVNCTYNEGKVQNTGKTPVAKYPVAHADLIACPGNSGSPIINKNTGCVIGWLHGAMRFRKETFTQGVYSADEINHIYLLKYMKGAIDDIQKEINKDEPEDE